MDHSKASSFKLLAAGTAIIATCSLLYLTSPWRIRREKRVVPTLTTLPQEIRLEIYRYLLTTQEAISEPGSLVKRPIYIGVDQRRITGLDAGILRASRQIYTEALPVLYRENVFAFQKSDCLKTLQSEGLAAGQLFRDRLSRTSW